MFLFLAAGFFAVYTINVVVGSLNGAAFLGGVGELLLLLAASIAFVGGILRREAAEKRQIEDDEHMIKRGKTHG
mgnify:CR=1 FL=1|tara:strand:- start:353 stop:574 length:222 start_codon:yes stop_codon:yes gene_type:complete